ncbi:hypothetical protein ACJJTC_010904 [Scirpophaga incertulas]
MNEIKHIADDIENISMEAKRNKTERTDIKADIPAIIKDLEQTNFTSVMSSNNAEAAAQCFVNLISTAIKNNSKIIQSRSKNRIIKPWITSGLLRCIRHRDRLYRKYKQSSCDPNHKIIFTRYRNFCNNLLRKVKKEYERHEFEKAKKDSKATWNVVKKITNLKSKTSSAEELLSVSASAVESVNLVNNYFANIGRDLASKISPISPANLPPAIGLSSLLPVQSMALLPTDFKEVETIIVIYSKCKQNLFDWLLPKSYEETEDLLKTIT